MKITISEISKNQNTVDVSFACAYGHGKGIWLGEETEIGLVCYVEFDIEEEPAIIRYLPDKKDYAIAFSNEINSLTGDILNIQDETVCFRFAETIIQLNYSFQNLSIGEWITVLVKPKTFSIHPLNL